MKKRAIGLIIGFTLGNFGWQAFQDQQWKEALKLSFFQAAAVAVSAHCFGKAQNDKEEN